MSNSLDPNQARFVVRHDLCPNRFQNLSENTRRQKKKGNIKVGIVDLKIDENCCKQTLASLP